MTHNLLLNYGLYRKMEIYVSASVAQNSHLCEILKRQEIFSWSFVSQQAKGVGGGGVIVANTDRSVHNV